MEQIEIGRELKAHCNKCKHDTIHVITAIENSKISKVMCKICMSYHKYRAPQDDQKPGESAKTKTTTKKTKTPKKKTSRRKKAARSPKESWESLISKVDPASATPYSLDGSYKTGMVLEHKSFGLGIIRDIVGENKIEVLFQNGLKTLVQNWQEN